MGLQQAVALCMDHCYSAELAGNDDWYKTVVLSGGTACLPGLAGISLPLSLWVLYIFATEQKHEMELRKISNSTFGIPLFQKG